MAPAAAPAAVTIPANQEALTQAVKSFGDKAKVFLQMKKADEQEEEKPEEEDAADPEKRRPCEGEEDPAEEPEKKPEEAPEEAPTEEPTPEEQPVEEPAPEEAPTEEPEPAPEEKPEEPAEDPDDPEKRRTAKALRVTHEAAAPRITDWNEAVAAYGYASARRKCPELYEEYMNDHR